MEKGHDGMAQTLCTMRRIPCFRTTTGVVRNLTPVVPCLPTGTAASPSLAVHHDCLGITTADYAWQSCYPDTPAMGSGRGHHPKILFATGPGCLRFPRLSQVFSLLQRLLKGSPSTTIGGRLGLRVMFWGGGTYLRQTLGPCSKRIPYTQ